MSETIYATLPNCVHELTSLLCATACSAEKESRYPGSMALGTQPKSKTPASDSFAVMEVSKYHISSISRLICLRIKCVKYLPYATHKASSSLMRYT